MECWNYSGQHIVALLVHDNRMLVSSTDKGIFIAKEDSKNVAEAPDKRSPAAVGLTKYSQIGTRLGASWLLRRAS